MRKYVTVGQLQKLAATSNATFFAQVNLFSFFQSESFFFSSASTHADRSFNPFALYHKFSIKVHSVYDPFVVAT